MDSVSIYGYLHQFMSYSEILCGKSLNLVLYENVKIIRNYRPDWLNNPITKRNLEIDFFLPDFNLGIEIQGEHHYDDSEQIFRDKLKSSILKSKNIHLIKLSILQTDPPKIWKIMCSYLPRQYIRPFNQKWCHFPEFKLYKQKIKESYLSSQSIISPIIHRRKENKSKISKEIMLKSSYNYKLRGKIVKIIPLEPLFQYKFKCRVAGSNEILTVKQNQLLKTDLTF